MNEQENKDTQKSPGAAKGCLGLILVVIATGVITAAVGYALSFIFGF
ncbi:MAG: hypothetical protein HY000_34140 [Planctomycetes bacterium]|nr:hypothetical protein [Planctomycetota bacterium]